jgi:dihydroorotate dehydrogenase
MGWYGSVGRRAFFALDPERSHRLAQRLLHLPLPWKRIGGAVQDAALATTLTGIPLRNPIGLAAGFDKTCLHLDVLGKLGFGYVVGGTITRERRHGHPSPRIVRDPGSSALTNAMGLPNPGASRAAAGLALQVATCPRIVSLADEDVPDVLAALAAVEPFVDGLELNASCPNVSWGRDTDDEQHLRDLVAGIRSATTKPVFVKLPPFATDAERTAVLALAEVAMGAGASGVTASNTRPAVDARLAMGEGGVSGRPLWDATPRIVADLRAAIGPGPAVNACGGVFSAGDIMTCLEAGATTVQVYTSLIYRGPGLPGELTRGLLRVLSERRSALADLA